MTGLDKMISQILEEAKTSAAMKLETAQKQADDILAKSQGGVCGHGGRGGGKECRLERKLCGPYQILGRAAAKNGDSEGEAGDDQ